MGRLPLPIESPEAQDIIREWRAGRRDTLAKKLGYPHAASLGGAIRSIYGVKVSQLPNNTYEVKEPEVIVTPAPLIKIKPIKQEGRRGEGEEAHLQPISDAHTGILTPSYNVKVFESRLDKLQQAIVNLCLLHRKMRPIKKLVTPFLGDITHGQQYGIQGYVEEFEMGAEEQIYTVLVPRFSNFFVNLLQVYQEIEIPSIPGNHGNVEPKSSRKTMRSNWDTVFYRSLQLALQNYPRIKFNITPPGQWYLVIEVNGWRFLLVHGDQIISYQGVPFYGLEKKGLRWKQSIGVDEPFDYILSAHVHNPNYLSNAGVPTYVNGCMISDSNFPLVRMGLKDVPQQWSLFVNRKHGVTASYRINLQ